MWLRFLVVCSVLRLIVRIRAVATEPCLVTEYSDVSQAVEKCQNIVIDNVAVPGGKTLKLDLLTGATVAFRGNITFGHAQWTGPLVKITGENVHVFGEDGAVLDGQGWLYWDGKGATQENLKPRFFRISVRNALLENVQIQNCPVLCTLIRNSENIIVRNWNIDNLRGEEGVVPKDKSGHNTDGINIEDTNDALIEYSTIYNQDDCVVVASGKNVTVRNIFCHGSHGLSVRGVGSVLEDVTFADSILTMGQNGIHIKTPPNGGEGLITNVTYSNITILDSTKYGINIQQNYGESGLAPSNNIPIKNLRLINIFGNVLNGAVPVFILCAQEGCFDWEWEGVAVYGAVQNNCTNYIPEGYDGC